MFKYFIYTLFLSLLFGCQSEASDQDSPHTGEIQASEIIVGAERMEQYLPLLEGKKVGVFANHTALVKESHLIDTLLALEVNVISVFSPEHGFKGNRPDGEVIENESADSFELISLYGSNKYPKDEDIRKIDVLVIDIQDVGVRCYTYASSMTFLMEVCAKNKVPVILLDRPNPNGAYVDGPVLDEKFKSFVGLHPIPLVHGLTLGELAKMINGEGWLKDSVRCNLTIIPVSNWNHDIPYSLPVPPSPNLPNDQSISLYPSLVLFEGTVVSVGRGTDRPFQIIGHPEFRLGSFVFTPQPNSGSKYPPLEGKLCYGQNLSNIPVGDSLNLSYLINYYQHISPQLEEPFFNNYFTNLAGTDQLQKQIEAKLSIDEIKQSWSSELSKFKTIREKYLIYK